MRNREERTEERRVERTFEIVEKCFKTYNTPNESFHIPWDELFVRNFRILAVFFQVLT